MALSSMNNADQLFSVGQAQFAGGRYREATEAFQSAIAQTDPNSKLGGEIQLWLVMAYEALDLREEARTLCRQLHTHPVRKIRTESKRVQYILEAPKLSTRSEWITAIPDLSQLPDADDLRPQGPAVTYQPPPRPAINPEPVDLSQVNTEENGFVWVAIAGLIVIVSLLLWP
jgi:tetratricopeptide (TPR) repeat protein